MTIIEDKSWSKVKSTKSDCIITDEKVIRKTEDKKDKKMLPLILLKHIVSVAFILFMIRVVYDFTEGSMLKSYLDYNQSRSLVVAIVDTLIIFVVLSGVYILNVMCPFRFAYSSTERVCIETVTGMNNLVTGIKIYVFVGKLKNTDKSDKSIYIPVEELADTIVNDKYIKFIGRLEDKEEIMEIQNNFNVIDVNKLRLLVNKCNNKGDN